MTESMPIDTFLEECFDVAERSFQQALAAVSPASTPVDSSVVQSFYHSARCAALSDLPAPVSSVEIGWL